MDLAERVLTDLIKYHAVQTFCLCPGGRNAPFVALLSRAKGLQVLSFFDERAAGFFAIGRVGRGKKPVAVLTTSGTAVAELLPAVIEAYYSHFPLFLITADRPARYRSTRAPQVIEQTGIFSHYVTRSWDLDACNLSFDLSLPVRGPVHLNICFDEPLIERSPQVLCFKTLWHQPGSDHGLIEKKEPAKAPEGSHISVTQQKDIPKDSRKIIQDFCAGSQKPLVIVSQMTAFTDQVELMLHKLALPVFAEALSGLRHSKQLAPGILKSGEGLFHHLMDRRQIDGVIRIGRCPSANWWRDLDRLYPFLPVLSVSDEPYPCRAPLVSPALENRSVPGTLKRPLSARVPEAVSFEDFFQAQDLLTRSFDKASPGVFQQDKEREQALKNLMGQFPLSELSFIRHISEYISRGSLVFLGNSLPIREWNLGASYKDKKFKYHANRGANGIDGLLSTFFGRMEESFENWCLLGDLSTLYDMTAPWILPQISGKCFIVVINNKGGQIFAPLFSDPLFLNTHHLKFQKWAEFWGMNYYCVTKWPEKVFFQSPAVIEIAVNSSQSRELNRQLNKL